MADTQDLLAAPGLEWTLTRTTPDAATDPRGLAALPPEETVSLSASVPGTAASAWRKAFGVEALETLDVDAWDWWFEARFAVDAADSQTPHTLLSDGIATYSEVWLNGTLIATSSNAFLGFRAEVPELQPNNTLIIKCASLSTVPTPRRPRSRWRSNLVAQDSIRWHRTPLLGHIPWAGTAKTAGPWAPLSLGPTAPLTVAKVAATLDGDRGTIRLSCSVSQDISIPVEVRVYAGAAAVSKPVAVSTAVVTDDVEIEVLVDHPLRWWPATHGAPNVYTVVVTAAGVEVDRRIVGFRTIVANTDSGAFELMVNNTPLFVRGMVWAPLDPLTLGGSAEQYRTAIALVAAAGANMLRISGTGAFEQAAFYEECTRAGIMVWQDAMLATLDPPEDPAWLATFVQELSFQLDRISHYPALAVISGGNEVEQQPILFGKEPGSFGMTVLEVTIPHAVSQNAPETVHVVSSPTASQPGSGISALQIRDGISHYFGVGAYTRPLSDARSSGVRFAAEALAFANPPEPSAITAMFGTSTPFSQDGAVEAWATGTARDPGASWSFTDTAEHYAREFFPEESQRPAGRGPEDLGSLDLRQLDFHRAAVHHAVFTTLVEWRRPESSCSGALVLSARDLTPGSGFGLTDSLGAPKSAWFAFRAASSARTIALHDEGLDGVDLHLFNDFPEDFSGTLELTVHGVTGFSMASAAVPMHLAARSAHRLTTEQLLGGFRDYGYAWKFGERSYDTMTAVLRHEDSTVAAQHTLLLGGVERKRGHTGISATFSESHLDSDISVASVEVRSDTVATFVALDVPGWTPEDNYFTLAAGTSRTVYLRSSGPDRQPLAGTVRALNDFKEFHVIGTTPKTAI